MDDISTERQPHAENVNPKISPSLRVAIKAVLSDTIQEFSLLHKASSQKMPVFQKLSSGNKSSNFEKSSDALIKELNGILFEALVRFENCRREDYITLPDGSFQKLTDDESILRTILMALDTQIDILKSMKKEVDLYGTFESLKAYCNSRQEIMDLPIDLAKKILDTDQKIRILQEKIAVMEEDFAKQIAFYDEVIGKLKHEWHEARQLITMSYEYLNSSYEHRAEYYGILFDHETEALVDATQSYRQRLNTEQRAVYEKSSCMLAELDSNANRLRYLQSQTTVQDLAKNIDILVKNLENLKVDHEKLKNDFKQCERVVLDHEIAQERARQEEEADQKTLVAVFQIQAWWRAMIIVRGIKVKSTRKSRRGRKK
ncbi:hypothetical protein Aperf_G00000025599 [Anoplocephala perfoliata]